MLETRQPFKSTYFPQRDTGGCQQCGFRTLHRSHSHSWFEQFLFVLGASLARCPQCNTRQANLRSFAVRLNSRDSGLDIGLRVLPYAFLASLLACTGIALWTLRSFHRWPF